MKVDFKRRSRMAREYVRAMKEVWTQAEVSSRGQFISFPPLKGWVEVELSAEDPASNLRTMNSSANASTTFRSRRFDYAKYAKSMRAGRKVMALYGPRHLGWLAGLCVIGRLWSRQSAYRVASLAGLTQRLTRRRATPLKVAQRTEAERALWAALSQPVTGLEAVAAG
jgi:alkanesulfonate monooxygenase SsuD/methylene tetrahydromethanopterin reductase-like flavin-dependent oxidoreductase (luciferase family)